MRSYSARAPCRIDLAGGWTDVPPFSAEHEGKVVNMAVTLYSRAAVVPNINSKVSLISEDFDTFVEASSIRELEYDGNLDLIKAALRRLAIPRGLECRTSSDAPPGSGLGTSASMGVAILGAINGLLPPERKYMSVDKIAMLANLLEVEELSIAGGKQDQYAAAYGGINMITFSDPNVELRKLTVTEGFTKTLEERLILCYTGKSRLSGDLIRRVMDSYQRGDPVVVEALLDMVRISEDVGRALVCEDLDDVAELISMNWENQKKLDPSISNDQIESLVSAALKSGALGAKACGAGGGGCLVIVSPETQSESVRTALLKRGSRILDFRVDLQGLSQESAKSANY